jgi:predicted regulator of Ras-like GTPase activity (Roadblock/LC7/MglB family)
MLNGLTEELNKSVSELLADLLVRAEAEAVFLCNKGGYILAESMVRDYEHNDNIAALAAGSFFATREIARLVGEPEFRCVFHHGERKGIFIHNTKSDLLLVLVFGRQSSPGLVKLCTEETCVAIDKLLKDHPEGESIEAMMQGIELTVSDQPQIFKVAR